MRELDRSKPFGSVNPPWEAPDALRPAWYEQGGALFDQNGFDVMKPLPEPEKPAPGADEALAEQKRQDAAKAASKPAETKPEAETQPTSDYGRGAASAPAAEPKGEPAAKTPSQVLALADGPFAAFRSEAKKILGATMPASKLAIIEALKEAQANLEPKQPAAVEAAPQAVTTPASPADVDLKAWAEGGKQYLFQHVREAIRTKYSAVVSTTHDAVDLLIQQGVVSAERARKD